MASPPHSHIHAAANVPLPESRPTTPARPSRATSPANGTPVAVGGGAPPPIPRRAAARARPAPGGSRPGTPANANAAETPATSESPEKLTKPVETTEEVKNETQVPPTTTGNVEQSQPETKEGEGLKADSALPTDAKVDGVSKINEDILEEKKSDDEPSNRSSQPSPVSDVFVDAPTPGEEVTDPVSEVSVADKTTEVQEKKSEDGNGEKRDNGEGEGEDTMTVVDTPTVPQPSELPAEKENGTEAPTEVLVNGHSEDVADEQEKEQQQQEPVQTPEEKMEEEKKRKEKEEWEKANYVGDSTWEERTWKEVNRLREDMFWARIGGVRDSE